MGWVCLAVTSLVLTSWLMWSFVYSLVQEKTTSDQQLAMVYYFINKCARYKESIATTPGYSLCGDGYCFCRDEYADCSCNIFTLSYVPRLPREIRHLNFSWNIGLELDHDDVLMNVTRITSLDLSYSVGMKSPNKSVFTSLKNLTDLRLEGNSFTYADLGRSVFPLQTLETLRIDANDLGPLPDGIFLQHPMPQLIALYMKHNHISSLNMSNLTPLVSLKILFVDGNQLWKVIPDFLPQLELLSVGMNSLSKLWETCRNGTSLFPNLNTLLMQANWLNGWVQRACLPKLKFLTLLQNTFIVLGTNMFNGHQLPALEALNLDNNNVPIESIQAHAFESSVLQGLYFVNNNLNFSSASIHEDSFVGCPNLVSLELSGNDFSHVTSTRFLRLFGHMTNLTYLDLSSANMRNFSAAMFANFVYLERLKLYNNRLTMIPDGAFNKILTPSGVKLYLQNNQIEIVQEDAFSVAIREKLSELDLSGNPFHCSCELRWFRMWLVTHPSLFNNSRQAYLCSNIPITTVQTFFVADQACLLSHNTSILIITVIVLIILSMILVTIFFRYRWHIRLVLYEAFRGQGNRQTRFQQQHFNYDVFVSYDQGDFSWVRDYLMKELEEGMGLRLCIHERDFIPGQNIVDNISDCVQSSKKVMMLFSRGFCRSEWCQFELNFCLRHVMECDDVLLVLILHDIPSRDLTTAMMAVMKTTTYIDWADEPDARDSFWRRIHIALAEILPGRI